MRYYDTSLSLYHVGVTDSRREALRQGQRVNLDGGILGSALPREPLGEARLGFGLKRAGEVPSCRSIVF
jgi:hypothetical protein